jgi:murein L,D-transpeptidase YcbB/YkuD
MQQCLNNFYELLNTSLYKKVKAGVPDQTQMQQIKACGYMTSSTEVNSVITLIQKYNLTQYDNGVYVPVTPTEVTHRTLKKGSKGEDVKALQTFLNINGYQCGIADGIFGSKTETAVKAFQKAHPECGSPDGIVGLRTWSVIDKMIG